MLALIDGDIVAYRASAAAQKMIAWDDGEEAQAWVNPEEAAKAAIDVARLWISQSHATSSLVCLSGDANFRKTVYPRYKSNRSGVVRPLALKHVRARLADEFKTASVDGLEADDLMGLMLTAPRATGKTVCVSLDKDLKTVPGLHFNPAKDQRPVFVMEAEANRWWFTQALMGDACDGYPGCPGVGPKKAARILDNWDGLDLQHGFDTVSMVFTDRGFTEADALVQLRVSRILRTGDYDKRKREVTLWHPTTPEVLNLDTMSAPIVA